MTGIVSDTHGLSALLLEFGALSFWDFACAAPYVNGNCGRYSGLVQIRPFIEQHYDLTMKRGEFDFESVRDLFQLEESQIYIHSLIGGPLGSDGDSAAALSAQRQAVADDQKKWGGMTPSAMFRLVLAELQAIGPDLDLGVRRPLESPARRLPASPLRPAGRRQWPSTTASPSASDRGRRAGRRRGT